MINYIKESSSKAKRSLDQYSLFQVTPIYIKDALSDGVDILKVIDKVESTVPQHTMQGVEAVYVGHFKEFDDRGINAMFRDGAIYVSNIQDDEADMIDDIIHEIAHAVEETYAADIYGSGEIQREFVGKRKRLESLMSEYGYLDNANIDFTDIEYSRDFDLFMCDEIGYEKLTNLAFGIFLRPYAVTDIREYFATSFEEYLYGDRKYLSTISPVAYKKVHLVCTGEV
tara:strand:- start:10647 stop:11327 length:681 start_codon:yes stop_codon:yes gene_type:complete